MAELWYHPNAMLHTRVCVGSHGCVGVLSHYVWVSAHVYQIIYTHMLTLHDWLIKF